VVVLLLLLGKQLMRCNAYRFIGIRAKEQNDPEIFFSGRGILSDGITSGLLHTYIHINPIISLFLTFCCFPHLTLIDG
jgi:hypothetical protein